MTHSYAPENVIEDADGESNAAVDLYADGVHADTPLALRNAQREMTTAQALLYTHPDYDAYIEKWEKYLDLYSANDIYQFIHKHPRETDESWQSRVNRGYFYNYCASVTDLFVAYLFSTDITRDPPDEELQEKLQKIQADADLRGTNWDTFIRTGATFAQIFGWCGYLVDAPQQTAEVVSEQDVEDQGIRPYVKHVLPIQLLDWDKDMFGKFLWVKIEVPVVEGRSFTTQVDGAERRFLIWDRQGWELWSVVQIEGSEPIATSLGKGESPPSIQGVVPFVVGINIPDVKHDWFGDSAIRDISDINIALMNWASLGDEEIANRCLNILTMERDMQNQVEAVISHCNILEYAPGSAPPQYLTPGTTPLDLIGSWIDRARDEIYRLAKLGGSTGLAGVREATSGIAYAYEFNETNQSLTAKASHMETCETELFQLICKWIGKEYVGTVSYSRDFGVDDLLLELDTILKARTSLTSESAIKQLEKNICNKLFARKPLEFRKKIEKEVDAAQAIPLPVEGFDSVSPALTSGKAG